VVPEPSTFLFFLSASHQDDLNQRKVTPAFVEEFHRQEKSLAPDSVVSFKIQQLPQIDRTREWGFYLTSIDKDKKWFFNGCGFTATVCFESGSSRERD
jgi:hypothetical protein